MISLKSVVVIKTSIFWDDSLLDTNNDWNIVRKKAKRILEIMGWDYLDIECTHTDIHNGKRIIGITVKS